MKPAPKPKPKAKLRPDAMQIARQYARAVKGKVSRERHCRCGCHRCMATPWMHGCGSPKCNGPKRWNT